jgi:hypothetical protein
MKNKVVKKSQCNKNPFPGHRNSLDFVFLEIKWT